MVLLRIKPADQPYNRGASRNLQFQPNGITCSRIGLECTEIKAIGNDDHLLGCIAQGCVHTLRRFRAADNSRREPPGYSGTHPHSVDRKSPAALITEIALANTPSNWNASSQL